MIKKALVSGSFDPITYGHINIIERACAMFDEVYVVIGINPEKSTLFTVDQRLEFMNKALAHLPRVNVGYFSGLLAEFAYHNAIPTIVRGIRNSADLEYEKILMSVNGSIAGLETVFLDALPKYACVSSSMVKSIVKEHGNVMEWVPLCVKQELETKILNKRLIGVVGNIGCGKSTLVKRILNIDLSAKFGTDTFASIDMDSLVHDIYASSDPYAIKAREMLVDAFGTQVLAKDSMDIDRKELGRQVFGNKTKMATLNHILKAPIRHALYEAMRHSKGNIILVEGAVIPQNGSCPVFNNNLLHVTCDTDVRITRIMNRNNISREEAVQRIQAQPIDMKQRELMEESIARYNHGWIVPFDTTQDYTDDDLGAVIVNFLTKL